LETVDENESKPVILNYSQSPPRRSGARKLLSVLAGISIPALVITGLATFDAATNPHSDFVFSGWLPLFLISAICPVWLLTLHFSSGR